MDYWNAVRRRKWRILAIVGLGLIMTAGLVTSWPAFYRSAATLSLEEYVGVEQLDARAADTYADRHVRRLIAETGEQSALLDIVDRAGLYRAEREARSDSMMADLVRRRLSFELIASELTPSDSPDLNRVTMDYRLFYRDPDPRVAREMLTQLAAAQVAAHNDYLAVKAEQRSAESRGAAEQLQAQIREHTAELAKLEHDIAALNTGDTTVLARRIEEREMELERSRADLDSAQEETAALEEQQARLKERLSGMQTTVVTTAEVTRPVDVNAKKKELDNKLAQATARLGEDHPQVKQIRSELNEVNEHLRQQAALKRKQTELEQLRKVLDKMRKTKPADDTDLVMLTQLKERFERELQAAPPEMTETRTVETRRPNPDHHALQSELKAVQDRYRAAVANADGLREKIAALDGELTQWRGELKQLRDTGQRYDTLTRDRQQVQDRLSELTARLDAMKPSTALGGSDSYGTAAVTKAAQLPSYSEKSQSYLVLIVGSLLSLFAGVFYLVFAERSDDSIRGATALAGLGANARPLGVIPYIHTAAEVARNRVRKMLISVSLFAGLALFAAAFRFLQQPLNAMLLRMF